MNISISYICANIFIFFIIHFVHFHFYEISVVLYSAVFDICISMALTRLIFYLVYKNKIKKLLSTSLFIFLLLLNYSLLVPTIIDRSVSLYLLNHIASSEKKYEIKTLKNVVKKEYVDKMKVVEQRILEQTKTGTLQINDGKVEMTQKGIIINYIAERYKAIFLRIPTALCAAASASK